ncbi:MAG: hypothetical protein ACJAWO_001359 [Halieaceae bacterium]|jgi:hypothetical protein
MLSFYSFTGFGNEIKKIDDKSTTASSSMNIKVIDANGLVILTDVVTLQNPNLAFNLHTMPAGDYTIQVLEGVKPINETTMSNLPKDNKVLTVEVLNEKGDKVYGSQNTKEAFNLNNMPTGEYVIHVYQGQKLINTNKIKR